MGIFIKYYWFAIWLFLLFYWLEFLIDFVQAEVLGWWMFLRSIYVPVLEKHQIWFVFASLQFIKPWFKHLSELHRSAFPVSKLLLTKGNTSALLYLLLILDLLDFLDSFVVKWFYACQLSWFVRFTLFFGFLFNNIFHLVSAPIENRLI